MGWSAVARADAPPAATAAPSLEQVEAARTPFRESRELYRAGKLSEAVARMLDAYEVASTPVIALEAGRLLVEAGRLVRARDLLRGVAGLPASPRESEAGRDARRSAALLATELDARIPKISLVERPAGVDVLLDGKPFSPADSAAWQGIDPGGHTIVVSLDDRACTSIAIALAEGQVRTIDLRDAARACRPASSAAPPPPASEAARTAVDEPPSRPAPTRPSAAWRWGGAALAGAGVAAVGAGMYVVFHAKSDYDSVSAGCTPGGCDADAFNVRHAAHEQANVATVVAGIGVAAIAGGLLWLVLGRPGNVGSPPRLGVGPSGVSLLVAVP
jgi:hypothetical protein